MPPEPDHQITRLLRAAAQARRAASPADTTPPLGFATRVLAAHRAAAQQGSASFFGSIYRRAVLTACGVTILAGFIGARDVLALSRAASTAPELRFASTALQFASR